MEQFTVIWSCWINGNHEVFHVHVEGVNASHAISASLKELEFSGFSRVQPEFTFLGHLETL